MTQIVININVYIFFLCGNKTCFLHLKSDLIPHSKATVLYIKKFLTPSPSLIHFSFRKKTCFWGSSDVHC